MVFWWLWFRQSEEQKEVRTYVVLTFLACLVAIALSQILVLSLPFRTRPLYVEELGMVMPFGMEYYNMSAWSSFPSDHAVLFFTLAFGFFHISRRMGWLAFLYVLVFVGLPRVYVGLHYPTDILVGGLVALSIHLLSGRKFFVDRLARPIVEWSNTQPQYFYPIFYFVSYQIADLFNASRNVLDFVWAVVRVLFK